MQLSELIGSEIKLLLPNLSTVNRYETVKLRGVEAGGIWIESQVVMNAFLQMIGEQATPRTMLFFLPYHEIRLALTFVDEPALNEKAFGV